jgi:hypothetical protein
VSLFECNPCFAELMHGWVPTKGVGTFETMIEETDRPRFREAFAQLLRNEPAPPLSLTIVRPDGTTLVALTLMRLMAPDMPGFEAVPVIHLIDQTEQKNSSNALPIARKCKPWANSQAVWRMILTTC